MGISGLIGAIHALPHIAGYTNDDFSDRLNHRITSAILILFATVVTTTQYVGRPIVCWVPDYFHGSWTKYVNSYCWVKNTYYLPFEEEVSNNNGKRTDDLQYYQWVPLVLVAQAFMFYLPSIFWRLLSQRTGLEVGDIIMTSAKLKRLEEPEVRSKQLYLIAAQAFRYLKLSKRRMPHTTTQKISYVFKFILTTCFCCCKTRWFSNYIISIYFMIKLLYLINVFGQMFLLNSFIGKNYFSFGIESIGILFSGFNSSALAQRFPSLTMCDFNIRRLGAIHGYTVQCVLSINIFNEKIYLFLWYWLWLVAIVTTGSLLQWCLQIFHKKRREEYIKNLLALARPELQGQEVNFDLAYEEEFRKVYLRYDGVFLFKIIEGAGGKLLAVETAGALWDLYLQSVGFYDTDNLKSFSLTQHAT